MSDEFTPTTEQVREALSSVWIKGLDDVYGDDWLDRWLAAQVDGPEQ